MSVPKVRKAYSIVNLVSPDDAEINMYGEVVSSRPVDWWTGEPVPGDFIDQSEFLQDLDQLKTKKNVTIHLNSVGGDFYAGLAIFNRICELTEQGVNVVTVNDSLCASAGSIILQAGSTRRVRSASQVMVHGVSGMLYGYYNAKDLKSLASQFDSDNKTLVAAYMKRNATASEQHIKNQVDAETWMTGREAVEEGYADEVVEDAVAPIAMLKDKSRMRIGNMQISAMWMPTCLPDNIDIVDKLPDEPANTASNPAAAPGGNMILGGNAMEIKTLDDLRAAYPDFTAQIETAAIQQATQQERNRLQEIEAIQQGMDTAMVNEAKFVTPISANELAAKAWKAQQQVAAGVLSCMAADAATTNQIPAEPQKPAAESKNLTPEERRAQGREAAKAIKKGE